MNILGINAYHGDASAVLLQEGRLLGAVEEERFTRIKHWAGFPRESILACLDLSGLKAGEIDGLAVSRNPTTHLARKAAFALAHRPNMALLKNRAENARRVREMPGQLAGLLGLSESWARKRWHWVEHHPAHLASGFFVSPFEQAAVCAIDGFGDFVSTSLAVGRGCELKVLERIYFPHSIGLFYLAITQYLGFLKYGDEYKVMGLAAYGKPEYAASLRRLIRLKPQGNFQLDLSYFCHWSGDASMTWSGGEPLLDPVFTPKLEELLGPRRPPDAPLEPRHEAIAASLQAVFEEAVWHVLRALFEKTRIPRLCLAGGCAMNSLMNGKIREKTPFEEVYIQPAAADNGTALGAAFYLWNQLLGCPRGFVMEHAYWGPEFGAEQMEKAVLARRQDLEDRRCKVRKIEDEDERCRWTAEQLSQGRIVGWFQGRMEWGARALGNRSILADPRRPDMPLTLNTKIKSREKFRPFAPSVLEESLHEYFVNSVPDPFMIQVYPIRPEKKSVIPAVTHVDGSGRLQTVSPKTNRLYARLLKAFGELTGVPVLLNTSFNENEPIVHKPEEALDCFLRTEMDVLVLGPFVIQK
jgi:carbamoyltransferase